jgi:DNA-binding NtrC family response regulator
MKVIIVDDEQKFIRMLAKRLVMRCIETDVVDSGEEAIKKITHTDYDVAVLDIKMPGISGLELKKELATIAPSLKFIFVSGHGTVNKSEKSSEKKDIYLSKPLDIEILIQKMNEVTKHG